MPMQYILTALSVLNSLVLLALLYIYARNYAHLKTKYNIGLLIFSFLFLIDNILASLMGIMAWPYRLMPFLSPRASFIALPRHIPRSSTVW